MLLADVVDASGRVTATAARTGKVAALAELLAHTPPEELPTVVALLVGEPRQGRVGVGWSTLAAIDASPAPGPELSIRDVDHLLDRLAALGGPGSAGERAALLNATFARATAGEADFLRRLLLGELRQGALEGVMTDAVARAARVPLAAVRRAAMLTGDLPEVARLALEGGEPALAAVALHPLRPVLPMLAASAGSVGEAIAACGTSSVEWKLDGARVQAHRLGDEVRLFTRNLADVTSRMPGVADVVRSLPAHTLVLDGEVLGLAEDERPELFQATMSRFGRRDGTGTATLAVRFFDCLHADGDDLLDEPLAMRLQALDRVAHDWRVPSLETADPVDAAAFLDDALAAGHEGVMVKSLTSPYEAGRRGGAWRKVKPVRTLDLVVLAAEWGSGRRRGWLSNIHLGARDPEAGGFVMVGKTFKGMTDAMLEWQTAEFLARETSRDAYTVHVRPELVVEVAFDGVQRSRRYGGGVTLRFARVRRYRDDKTAADADTIDAVRAWLPPGEAR